MTYNTILEIILKALELYATLWRTGCSDGVTDFCAVARIVRYSEYDFFEVARTFWWLFDKSYMLRWWLGLLRGCPVSKLGFCDCFVVACWTDVSFLYNPLLVDRQNKIIFSTYDCEIAVLHI